MAGEVRIKVVEGPMRGTEYTFNEHDTFLFGRMSDCHARLTDDAAVSRHHFMMELDPPHARIRDLGSLNGTHVNGARCGDRERHETQEEGKRRRYPEVDLQDGDHIRVGTTVLKVCIRDESACLRCGRLVSAKESAGHALLDDTAMCGTCYDALIASGEPLITPGPVQCQTCGSDVSSEVVAPRSGDEYVCKACRQESETDPIGLLRSLLDIEPGTTRGGEVPEVKGYKIDRRLGMGGFGAVYLASRNDDCKHVAVKVMLPRVTVDERAREGFLREVGVTKGLRHENIVHLVQSGADGGLFYFVMEYCAGGSVQDLMHSRGGRLSVEEAAPIILQALAGLSFAHDANVVHRDIKPGNILLAGKEGHWTAKVSDLGLAKSFEKAGLSGMTLTGSHAGTPFFMPREQLTNFKYALPVSDVWGMGATFYYMLTAQLPHEFRPDQDPIEVILRGGIVPIHRRDPDIPAAVADVVDRAIADKTEDRFQDAREMREALISALQ